MSIDDDPTVVLPGTVRPFEYASDDPKGFDAVIEHPNGDVTFVRNPDPWSPNGFKVTLPASARGKNQKPQQGPIGEALDFAADMVFVWWGIVALLAVFFAIAEVGFEVPLLIAAYGGMAYGVWSWISKRRKRRADL